MDHLALENELLREQIKELTGAHDSQCIKDRFILDAISAKRRIEALEAALHETSHDGRLQRLDGQNDKLITRVITLELQLLKQTEQMGTLKTELEIYKDLGGHVLEPEERPRQANSV